MKLAKYSLIILFVLFASLLKAQDGLVAHWSFDSLSNNQFIDHVTNEVGGKVFGGAILVNGPVGNALEFDGIDDFARVPDYNQPPPEIFQSLDQGSISLWFRVDDIPKEYGIRPIFYYGTERECDFFDAANKGMIIEVGHSPIHNSSKRLYFTEWTNGCTYPSFCYDSWNPIIEGQWYHYVSIVGSDFNTGYLNGHLMTERRYNFGTAETHEFFSDALSHEKLWIGKGYWDTNEMLFDGAIDEIKIFDRPLTESEVDSLFLEGNLFTTDIGKVQDKPEIFLYPNPANERLNIEFNEQYLNPLTFRLYNSNGNLVYKLNIQSSEKTRSIELSDLPHGVYIYSIEEGSRILISDKLVIQNF